MPDFDPSDDLDTQEQADAYVNWCADNFMRLSQGPKRTYRTAVRCAHWLLVVATAQLHLEEGVDDYEALLEQLARYQALGRAIERQRQRFPVEQLIVLRASLDCWSPVGVWAEHLLGAAKCAVSALILIDMHPLIDLWDLPANDVWVLLAAGGDYLAAIDVESLEFADFAVQRNEGVAAKFTWQRINNLSRHMGAPPVSPN